MDQLPLDVHLEISSYLFSSEWPTVASSRTHSNPGRKRRRNSSGTSNCLAALVQTNCTSTTKFTQFIIRRDSSFEFRNEEQGYQYKFRLVKTWSIEFPQSGMTQLSHLDYFRAQLSYFRLDKFYWQLVTLIERITQVKHVQIELDESRRLMKRKYRAQADAIMKWLSSLTTLNKLQGYMSQTRLDQFLRKTQTAGPLKLVISEHPVLMGESAHLNKRLHRTVNDLMRRNVISEFSHPTKCSCQAGCFIKGQPGHRLLSHSTRLMFRLLSQLNPFRRQK